MSSLCVRHQICRRLCLIRTSLKYLLVENSFLQVANNYNKVHFFSGRQHCRPLFQDFPESEAVYRVCGDLGGPGSGRWKAFSEVILRAINYMYWTGGGIILKLCLCVKIKAHPQAPGINKRKEITKAMEDFSAYVSRWTRKLKRLFLTKMF